MTKHYTLDILHRLSRPSASRNTVSVDQQVKSLDSRHWNQQNHQLNNQNPLQTYKQTQYTHFTTWLNKIAAQYMKIKHYYISEKSLLCITHRYFQSSTLTITLSFINIDYWFCIIWMHINRKGNTNSKQEQWYNLYDTHKVYNIAYNIIKIIGQNQPTMSNKKQSRSIMINCLRLLLYLGYKKNMEPVTAENATGKLTVFLW